MSKFSLSSLRRRAIVLVLLAIFPLLALTLYSYFHQRDRAIREVQRDELVAARNLATIQETVISNARQLLATLALMPQVQRRDRAACDRLFARVLEQSPYFVALVGADPEGGLFSSAPAAPGPINYADRLWFQKTIQARAFFVGEPLIGRISHKYTLNVAHPILDDAGRLQGVITAGIDLHWLGSLLTKSDFPPTTAIVLTDSSRKVVFRYPEPQKYIGKMLPNILIEAMSTRDEGVAAGVGLPGDERLFAFTRLSPPWQQMWLSIGLPRDWAVGPVNRALWRNLICLGLGALFAMAAALYGGDLFIVQPVKRLQAVTDRLAAGDLSMRAGPDYPVGELGLLAHSFDQMADSLQKREAALRESEERFRAFMDNSPTISWAKNEAGRYVYLSKTYEQRFGVRLAESRGKSDYHLWPPEIAEEFRKNDLKVMEGGHAIDVIEKTRNNDGGLCYWWNFKFPFFDAAGVRYIGGIGVDITERLQAEEALRQARDELEQRVEERTAELGKSNTALKKSEEKLRFLTSQVLSAQEKERNRIAMELHEGLGQSMTALKLYLRQIERHLPPEKGVIQEELNGARTLLSGMIQEVRQISRALRPLNLKNLGLTVALENLLIEFGNYQEVMVKADIDDIQSLFSPESEIHIYRIFQESLNNIAKHAKATEVTVNIERQNGMVNFNIKDNGGGFNPKQISYTNLVDKGMGLASMEERLRIINSQLHIVSQPGEGTEITFSIPINAK